MSDVCNDCLTLDIQRSSSFKILSSISATLHGNVISQCSIKVGNFTSITLKNDLEMSMQNTDISDIISFSLGQLGFLTA